MLDQGSDRGIRKTSAVFGIEIGDFFLDPGSYDVDDRVAVGILAHALESAAEYQLDQVRTHETLELYPAELLIVRNLFRCRMAARSVFDANCSFQIRTLHKSSFAAGSSISQGSVFPV